MYSNFSKKFHISFLSFVFFLSLFLSLNFLSFENNENIKVLIFGLLNLDLNFVNENYSLILIGSLILFLISSIFLLMNLQKIIKVKNYNHRLN